ncbi:unnamed protein product [Pseudo-nitzschia multistriata]|uniref:CUE domain-containing protein n=1 Tax=Pseudo-nitzschia multistriata TaxID=183589 RepID=A0A448Z5Z4_9STRA|nr:unnamed protein product [Pseudo-nitzschia multistriata]
MGITYEEALATLEAMFGDPWTRESLDAVLRHEKGHMENTCERILEHGEKDPVLLVERLRNGGPEPQVAMDEEYARRLAGQEEGSVSSGRGSSRSGGGHRDGGGNGRGTPTILPSDFLRLPGFRPPPSSTASSSASSSSGANRAAGAGAGRRQPPHDDETLARMLQDELFSEELARNPDFAHLAGRNPRRSSARPSASNARLPAAPAGAPLQNPFEGVNVMQKLSTMGDGARRKLQLFATNFEDRMKGINHNNGAHTGGLQEARGAAAERRGLLDNDDDDYGEDMIEFETRKSR